MKKAAAIDIPRRILSKAGETIRLLSINNAPINNTVKVENSKKGISERILFNELRREGFREKRHTRINNHKGE